MFVIGNFVIAIAKVINTIGTLYVYILIIRALISWFSPDPYNPLVQMLYKVTEPVLNQVKRIIPNFGGFDISLIVTIILIQFLQSFIVSTLMQLGRNL